MTMPYGGAEEPDVIFTEQVSTPVHVVSSDAKPGKSIGTEFGYWRTFLIANTVASQVATPGAVRICNRSLRRHRLQIKVNTGGNVTTTPSVTALPAISVSGQAVQNPNGVPVNVTLAGFTATQVFVNGILVGAGNGTYVVPAYGSISVTFTVLGTTATAGIATSGPQSVLDGVIVGNRDFIQNSQQAGVSPYVAGSGGGFLGIGDSLRWECQQELWACYPASNTGPVLVTVTDEIYASDPEAWRENE